MTRSLETEVFVAGGGPAGLAAAIAARHAGFNVVLADRSRPPIDKACGEGIMPDGLDALARLGVSVPPDACVPFRGIRFIDDSATVVADFPVGTGRGIRRTTLHDMLLNAAAGAGVSMMWGSNVSACDDPTNSIMVDGRPVHARWLIAADGHGSRLAAAAGLHDSGPGRLRVGFRGHYRIEPWSEHVEVHWSDHGQLYITPIASDEVCVAFVTRRKDLRLPDALRYFGAAHRRLRGAPSAKPVLGAITATRKLRAVFRGNLALTGDASGSVDAITGEGLSMAFRQATALAAAMRAGDLAFYQRAHAAIMRRPLMMAELMLLMDRHPGLRHRVLRVLAATPHLFEKMLAIHIGGWRLMAA
ncbi:MAG TPA: FAD-dependent monooxygenase [Thermoanaerobaculia bacterium]|jgi:flavin-dependent dehydrogenase|nr:FAD-dependent monooxygenase [Thermoanaerobaculia bacterium]